MDSLRSGDGSQKAEDVKTTAESLRVNSQTEVSGAVSAAAAVARDKWRAIICTCVLVALLGGWELIVMDRYFYLHGVSVYAVLFEGGHIPILQFVTADKMLGLIIEIVAWAGTAVIVRRIVRLARDAKSGHLNFWQDLLDSGADYLESIFLTLMLMALLRVPKITLGTGINITLDDASIDVIIALACVLGWSVRDTRILVARIFRSLFGDRGGRSN